MAMPLSEAPTELLAKPDRWTAPDLDHLSDNGMRYEVLNGQLVVTSAPNLGHQRLIKWLDRSLEDALPDGHFSVAGVGVLMGDDEAIPDLIVGVGDIPMDDRGLPAAQVVLAVEVVSASTTMQDRMVKPLMYAEAGIPNYWRIEINTFKGRLPGEELPVLFAHSRGDDGEYQLTHRIAAGTSATLHSPFEFTVGPATLMR